MVTVRDDCTMPVGFTPFVELYAPTYPLPTPWLSCGLKDKDHCYYFDGLTLLPPGDWWLDKKLYYEKWEITGGYYFYFGFFDSEITHPADPPGDFCVEAVAVYYYADKREHKEKDAKPTAV